MTSFVAYYKMIRQHNDVGAFAVGLEVVLVWQKFHRWLYEGGRPNALTRVINRGWAIVHSLGIAPNYLVTLEVMGRRSGRVISFPLAMVVLDGERYLVSMLGNGASWVQNVRAANGQATLRHRRTELVQLEEVALEQRARVLKAYLRLAPGARPHIPVDKNAPLEEFQAIAEQFPVFRIVTIKLGKSFSGNCSQIN